MNKLKASLNYSKSFIGLKVNNNYTKLFYTIFSLKKLRI